MDDNLEIGVVFWASVTQMEMWMNVNCFIMSGFSLNSIYWLLHFYLFSIDSEMHCATKESNSVHPPGTFPRGYNSVQICKYRSSSNPWGMKKKKMHLVRNEITYYTSRLFSRQLKVAQSWTEANFIQNWKCVYYTRTETLSDQWICC